MALNVGNCPQCGKLYVKSIKDACPACLKEIDKQYEVCLKFLRENRGCTINELSDETGVSIRQITRFIREGRISLMNAPNMSYPCEVCGTLIRENSMCDLCRSKLARDVQNLNEDERRKREVEKKRDSRESFQIKDRIHDRHNT